VTEAQLVSGLNAIVLIVYIGALLLGAAKTAQRVVSYSRRHLRRPRLLTRDLIVFGGHALTFLLVGLNRAFNWGPTVSGRWWWIVISATPALVGVLTYCWFEFFVIERAARSG
jgi:hypothetical protein